VPNLVTTVELSPEEFRRLAEAALPGTEFAQQPSEWLGERIVDESGRVSSLRIGSAAVPGTEVRNIYSLRSACFEAEWTGHSFLFTVTGYGHGAGMSQYGANIMAKNGSDYAGILAHYYPGTELIASQIDN
jgi:stage II sporulation protein D